MVENIIIHYPETRERLFSRILKTEPDHFPFLRHNDPLGNSPDTTVKFPLLKGAT